LWGGAGPPSSDPTYAEVMGWIRWLRCWAWCWAGPAGAPGVVVGVVPRPQKLPFCLSSIRPPKQIAQLPSIYSPTPPAAWNGRPQRSRPLRRLRLLPQELGRGASRLPVVWRSTYATATAVGCSSRPPPRRWWGATSKLPWTTSSQCLTSRTVSLYSSTCPDWRALARRQQRSARGDRK
jgi:hypothetical protein